MKKRVYVLLVVLVIAAIISFSWWKQAISPINQTDKTPVTFRIQKGESVRDIAKRLQKEGFIRSALALFIMARFGGTADNIQAGDFRLSPSMDLDTIANTLTHGITDIWLTIPEGWRKEEIATKIAKELNIPESEFLKVAREGYMFPDTYLIPQESTAAAVAEMLLNNFNKKVAGEKERIKQDGLTLADIIIIASLVEREAKLASDRPLVASVILNRVEIGMKLDIDATIQYALGYQGKEKTWWKKELTSNDLAFESPYNTYQNPGLPPTAIANPGLAAIKAVVEAPKTDYLYYISDKTGKLHFAENIEEHNNNIARYLNK